MSPQVVFMVAVHVVFCARDFGGGCENFCGLDGGLGGVVQPATLALGPLDVGAVVDPVGEVELVAAALAAELEPPESWFSHTEMPTMAPMQRRTTAATIYGVDVEA
jgi:hypothetical protein